jgi:hypothetical protein
MLQGDGPSINIDARKQTVQLLEGFTSDELRSFLNRPPVSLADAAATEYEVHQ